MNEIGSPIVNAESVGSVVGVGFGDAVVGTFFLVHPQISLHITDKHYKKFKLPVNFLSVFFDTVNHAYRQWNV